MNPPTMGPQTGPRKGASENKVDAKARSCLQHQPSGHKAKEWEWGKDLRQEHVPNLSTGVGEWCTAECPR